MVHNAVLNAKLLAPRTHNQNPELISIIDRIEAREKSKREIAEDIKDIYTEAKGNGFHPKIIRKIIAIRRRTAEERKEEAALLNTYMGALGMQLDLPLESAA